MSEYDINQKVAEQICRDFRWNGRTFKLGEYVGLLDGEPRAGYVCQAEQQEEKQ